MKKLVTNLVTKISKDLKSEGFKKSLSYLIRRDAVDYSDFIFVGSRIHAAYHIELCSLNIGIFIPAIESILGSNYPNKVIPTIGIPIHMLTEDQKYHEWELNSEKIDCVCEDMLNWINKYAFPFFDSFRAPEALVAQLSQNAPLKRLAMPPTRRSEILAASLVLLGRKSEAISFLEEQIKINEKKSPKYWLHSQELLGRIVKVGNV